MKRIITFMMAMLMIAVLCVPAFATGENCTITITSAKPNETYHIYKIFDLSYGSTNAYSYYLPKDSQWEDFFTTGEGKSYFTIEPNTGLAVTVKTVDDTNIKSIADKMLAYIETNSVAPTDTKHAAANGSAVEFTGLDYGYYLVDTTVGSVCILQSLNKDETIADKALEPTVDKMVEEDDAAEDHAWGDTASAAIGQLVNFRAKIENIAKIKNLVYHDIMSQGLTLNSDTIKVYMRTSAGANPVYLTKDTDYRIVISPDDGCTFEVEIYDNYLKTLSKGNYLVVEYAARLNADAVVNDSTSPTNGNSNKARVEYGDAQKTAEDEVLVKTWKVNISKVDVNKTPLAGAKFAVAKLVNSDTSTQKDVWRFVADVDNNGVPKADNTGWTDLIHVDKGTYPDVPGSGIKIFESSGEANSFITLSGCDSHDTYLLFEVEAPDGYNKLAAPIAFDVDGATGLIDWGDNENVNKIEVVNKTGAVLPSTGGIGTTMFILIGSLLVLFSGVLLATKLRMSKMRG